MGFSLEQKQKIADAINSRRGESTCERCGSNNFEVLGNYVILQSHGGQGSSLNLGQGFRAAGIACGNCGNIVLHSLDIILPEETF